MSLIPDFRTMIDLQLTQAMRLDLRHQALGTVLMRSRWQALAMSDPDAHSRLQRGIDLSRFDANRERIEIVIADRACCAPGSKVAQPFNSCHPSRYVLTGSSRHR